MNYVIFSKSESNSFILKFLKKDFQHCEVITGNHCISATSIGINFYYIHNVNKAIEVIKNNDIMIIKCSKKINENTISRRFFTINSCVSIVKDVLNIRNVFIQTPYQLYKYLIKMESKK